MATESDVPLSVSATDKEGMDRYVTRTDLDQPFKVNQLAQSEEIAASTSFQVETAISNFQGKAELPQGEFFSEPPLVVKLATKQRVEGYQMDDVPGEVEEEMQVNGKMIQKDSSTETPEVVGPEEIPVCDPNDAAEEKVMTGEDRDLPENAIPTLKQQQGEVEQNFMDATVLEQIEADAKGESSGGRMQKNVQDGFSSPQMNAETGRMIDNEAEVTEHFSVFESIRNFFHAPHSTVPELETGGQNNAAPTREFESEDTVPDKEDTPEQNSIGQDAPGGVEQKDEKDLHLDVNELVEGKHESLPVALATDVPTKVVEPVSRAELDSAAGNQEGVVEENDGPTIEPSLEVASEETDKPTSKELIETISSAEVGSQEGGQEPNLAEALPDKHEYDNLERSLKTVPEEVDAPASSTVEENSLKEIREEKHCGVAESTGEIGDVPASTINTEVLPEETYVHASRELVEPTSDDKLDSQAENHEGVVEECEDQKTEILLEMASEKKDAPVSNEHVETFSSAAVDLQGGQEPNIAEVSPDKHENEKPEKWLKTEVHEEKDATASSTVNELSFEEEEITEDKHYNGAKEGMDETGDVPSSILNKEVLPEETNAHASSDFVEPTSHSESDSQPGNQEGVIEECDDRNKETSLEMASEVADAPVSNEHIETVSSAKDFQEGSQEPKIGDVPASILSKEMLPEEIPIHDPNDAAEEKVKIGEGLDLPETVIPTWKQQELHLQGEGERNLTEAAVLEQIEADAKGESSGGGMQKNVQDGFSSPQMNAETGRVIDNEAEVSEDFSIFRSIRDFFHAPHSTVPELETGGQNIAEPTREFESEDTVPDKEDTPKQDSIGQHAPGAVEQKDEKDLHFEVNELVEGKVESLPATDVSSKVVEPVSRAELDSKAGNQEDVSEECEGPKIEPSLEVASEEIDEPESKGHIETISSAEVGSHEGSQEPNLAESLPYKHEYDNLEKSLRMVQEELDAPASNTGQIGDVPASTLSEEVLPEETNVHASSKFVELISHDELVPQAENYNGVVEECEDQKTETSLQMASDKPVSNENMETISSAAVDYQGGQEPYIAVVSPDKREDEKLEKSLKTEVHEEKDATASSTVNKSFKEEEIREDNHYDGAKEGTNETRDVSSSILNKEVKPEETNVHASNDFVETTSHYESDSQPGNQEGVIEERDDQNTETSLEMASEEADAPVSNEHIETISSAEDIQEGSQEQNLAKVSPDRHEEEKLEKSLKTAIPEEIDAPASSTNKEFSFKVEEIGEEKHHGGATESTDKIGDVPASLLSKEVIPEEMYVHASSEPVEPLSHDILDSQAENQEDVREECEDPKTEKPVEMALQETDTPATNELIETISSAAVDSQEGSQEPKIGDVPTSILSKEVLLEEIPAHDPNDAAEEKVKIGEGRDLPETAIPTLKQQELHFQSEGERDLMEATILEQIQADAKGKSSGGGMQKNVEDEFSSPKRNSETGPMIDNEMIDSEAEVAEDFSLLEPRTDFTHVPHSTVSELETGGQNIAEPTGVFESENTAPDKEDTPEKESTGQDTTAGVEQQDEKDLYFDANEVVEGIFESLPVALVTDVSSREAAGPPVSEQIDAPASSTVDKLGLKEEEIREDKHSDGVAEGTDEIGDVLESILRKEVLPEETYVDASSKFVEPISHDGLDSQAEIQEGVLGECEDPKTETSLETASEETDEPVSDEHIETISSAAVGFQERRQEPNTEEVSQDKHEDEIGFQERRQEPNTEEVSQDKHEDEKLENSSKPVHEEKDATASSTVKGFSFKEEEIREDKHYDGATEGTTETGDVEPEETYMHASSEFVEPISNAELDSQAENQEVVVEESEDLKTETSVEMALEETDVHVSNEHKETISSPGVDLKEGCQEPNLVEALPDKHANDELERSLKSVPEEIYAPASSTIEEHSLEEEERIEGKLYDEVTESTREIADVSASILHEELVPEETSVHASSKFMEPTSHAESDSQEGFVEEREDQKKETSLEMAAKETDAPASNEHIEKMSSAEVDFQEGHQEPNLAEVSPDKPEDEKLETYLKPVLEEIDAPASGNYTETNSAAGDDFPAENQEGVSDAKQKEGIVLDAGVSRDEPEDDKVAGSSEMALDVEKTAPSECTGLAASAKNDIIQDTEEVGADIERENYISEQSARKETAQSYAEYEEETYRKEVQQEPEQQEPDKDHQQEVPLESMEDTTAQVATAEDMTVLPTTTKIDSTTGNAEDNDINQQIASETIASKDEIDIIPSGITDGYILHKEKEDKSHTINKDETSGDTTVDSCGSGVEDLVISEEPKNRDISMQPIQQQTEISSEDDTRSIKLGEMKEAEKVVSEETIESAQGDYTTTHTAEELQGSSNGDKSDAAIKVKETAETNEATSETNTTGTERKIDDNIIQSYVENVPEESQEGQHELGQEEELKLEVEDQTEDIQNEDETIKASNLTEEELTVAEKVVSEETIKSAQGDKTISPTTDELLGSSNGDKSDAAIEVKETAETNEATSETIPTETERKIDDVLNQSYVDKVSKESQEGWHELDQEEKPIPEVEDQTEEIHNEEETLKAAILTEEEQEVEKVVSEETIKSAQGEKTITSSAEELQDSCNEDKSDAAIKVKETAETNEATSETIPTETERKIDAFLNQRCVEKVSEESQEGQHELDQEEKLKPEVEDHTEEIQNDDEAILRFLTEEEQEAEKVVSEETVKSAQEDKDITSTAEELQGSFSRDKSDATIEVKEIIKTNDATSETNATETKREIDDVLNESYEEKVLEESQEGQHELDQEEELKPEVHNGETVKAVVLTEEEQKEDEKVFSGETTESAQGDNNITSTAEERQGSCNGDKRHAAIEVKESATLSITDLSATCSAEQMKKNNNKIQEEEKQPSVTETVEEEKVEDKGMEKPFEVSTNRAAKEPTELRNKEIVEEVSANSDESKETYLVEGTDITSLEDIRNDNRAEQISNINSYESSQFAVEGDASVKDHMMHETLCTSSSIMVSDPSTGYHQNVTKERDVLASAEANENLGQITDLEHKPRDQSVEEIDSSQTTTSGKDTSGVEAVMEKEGIDGQTLQEQYQETFPHPIIEEEFEDKTHITPEVEDNSISIVTTEPESSENASIIQAEETCVQMEEPTQLEGCQMELASESSLISNPNELNEEPKKATEVVGEQILKEEKLKEQHPMPSNVLPPEHGYSIKVDAHEKNTKEVRTEEEPEAVEESCLHIEDSRLVEVSQSDSLHEESVVEEVQGEDLSSESKSRSTLDNAEAVEEERVSCIQTLPLEKSEETHQLCTSQEEDREISGATESIEETMMVAEALEDSPITTDEAPLQKELKEQELHQFLDRTHEDVGNLREEKPEEQHVMLNEHGDLTKFQEPEQNVMGVEVPEEKPEATEEPGLGTEENDLASEANSVGICEVSKIIGTGDEMRSIESASVEKSEELSHSTPSEEEHGISEITKNIDANQKEVEENKEEMANEENEREVSNNSCITYSKDIDAGGVDKSGLAPEMENLKEQSETPSATELFFQEQEHEAPAKTEHIIENVEEAEILKNESKLEVGYSDNDAEKVDPREARKEVGAPGEAKGEERETSEGPSGFDSHGTADDSLTSKSSYDPDKREAGENVFELAKGDNAYKPAADSKESEIIEKHPGGETYNLLAEEEYMKVTNSADINQNDVQSKEISEEKEDANKSHQEHKPVAEGSLHSTEVQKGEVQEIEHVNFNETTKNLTHADTSSIEFSNQATAEDQVTRESFAGESQRTDAISDACKSEMMASEEKESRDEIPTKERSTTSHEEIQEGGRAYYDGNKMQRPEEEEEELSEAKERKISTDREQAPEVPKELGAANSAEAKARELGTKEIPDDKEHHVDAHKETGPKNSLFDMMHRSTKETQATRELSEFKEKVVIQEGFVHVEAGKSEEHKSDEEKDDEEEDEAEEGEEHKKTDSGSDGPVMVEAHKGMEIKTPNQKKSHNILSGMGSKVKHSISKVKKAITGKSSHSKQHSPK